MTKGAISITETKGVVETRDTESLHNSFFMLSQDMFFIVGFDGYVKRLNPMCEKMLSFKTEELLAKPLLELVHPEDRELTSAQWQHLLESLDTISFENRYRCKDGSYKWLLWNATPCHEQQLIYAAARDITLAKQAEEALKASEERFRLLVESVNDYAIYMLDECGRVVSWNKGAERINGYPTVEVIGKHFSCFYTREDIERGKPEQVLKTAAAEGRFEDETWRLRKDSSGFWANVVVTALRDESSGKLRGFAIVTRDVTDRVRSQEALQQAHDELERRVQERTAELQAANTLLKWEIDERASTEAALRQSKARLRTQASQLSVALQELQRTQAQLVQAEKMSSLGQLVAGIAHEINNPVSFIYGNLEYASPYIEDLLNLLRLYQQHYPQPVPEIKAASDTIDINFIMADLPKLLSSMQVGADRIRQIVLSLQNFSRHDQAQKKSVNIHEGIDSTLMILKNRLKAIDGHPEITVVKDYGDLPLVECYAGQLNQVFMNVLSNAIDALEVRTPNSELPDYIKIRTEVQQGMVTIFITDNGCGMTEEVRRKLFDPFFTTKTVGKGTGLGLSISYQIVIEKHGGQLTCVSELGKGTEFVIRIPHGQQHQLPCLNATDILLPSHPKNTYKGKGKESLPLPLPGKEIGNKSTGKGVAAS